MFSYVTAYTKFLSETNAKRKSELRNIYHDIETSMSSDDIRCCRSLVLGWHAKDMLSLDAHYKGNLFDSFKSKGANGTLYKSDLKKRFEDEANNAKELRKMKVRFDLKFKLCVRISYIYIYIYIWVRLTL